MKPPKENEETTGAQLPSSDLLADYYLVNDGTRIHLMHADDWECGGNGLLFKKEGKIIAWFTRWTWWKRGIDHSG
jgi:hypothetical protein